MDRRQVRVGDGEGVDRVIDVVHLSVDGGVAGGVEGGVRTLEADADVSASMK